MGNINLAYEPYILWYAYNSINVTPGLYLGHTLFLISKCFTSQKPFFHIFRLSFTAFFSRLNFTLDRKIQSAEEGCERQLNYTETKRKKFLER